MALISLLESRGGSNIKVAGVESENVCPSFHRGVMVNNLFEDV